MFFAAALSVATATTAHAAHARAVAGREAHPLGSHHLQVARIPHRMLDRILIAFRPAHPRRPGPPHVAYGVWDRLAQCETGGDWRWGSQFVSPVYEGGIGFARSTWIAYRLPGYPWQAWRATRDQQIAVGRRVLAAAGPGAWGCAATAGLTPGA
ncbi:MAG TPA: transglycosylase family protein [Mycobacteriales bacterium]|nr:transglycosylase family protein [Mycobacteriales bacterium]